LWTRFTPTGAAIKPLRQGQTVEQRWFIGAHCTVGGGYANDELAQIPLAWLHEKAAALGLGFRNQVASSGNEHLCPPVDSYAKFLKGLWRVVKLGNRFHRPIDERPYPVKNGTADAVNQVIDASIVRRCQHDPSKYRPPNLDRWAKRKGIDLQTTAGDLVV
jgi:hypothetical protein